ncbi:LolA family protein [Leptospira idonii]|uniref:Outer membrane lipoprotein carrier protein LolA n=1 Tax=Leptospira idonii TaxID=1193500 RepID=A0A4R9M476_9LEPT|nr:outer membrane lipoprotein carrier protein LolA [Leptospira idonii]TGN20069.1 outer membrane lipoprotein carrier protein LolA [Leptospira idonii]
MKALVGSICLAIALGSPVFSQTAPAHNWHSPSEVVKKIKKKFSEIGSYSADFQIRTEENKKEKTMRGKCLYKRPGKIRYNFNEPEGDEIVSDGKTLYIFIKKLGAVGKQDLSLDKKNSSGPIFTTNSADGLARLFRKYHYKFDAIEQPRLAIDKDPTQYFVLELDQREKIGGFEKMKLFVDSQSYLIKRAVATDGRGKVTTIAFSNINFEEEIQDGVFNFHISGNAKIVNNPLVSEN